MPNKAKKKTQKRIHFRRCIVLGCGSTSRNSSRDVSFHTLPKATLGWVRTHCAKHLPTGVNLCRVFICSRHYHPSYLNITPAPGARRLLTTNAIPTIFPPFPGEGSQALERVAETAPAEKPAEIDRDSSGSTSSNDSELPLIPPLTSGPVCASASEESSSSSSETSSVSGPEEPDEQTTCRPKRTTKPRPPAPTGSTTTAAAATAALPANEELRLAVEHISLQCDRVVAVLDRLDHRRIPPELLGPLQELVSSIQTAPQRKRASVEAAIEIFDNDIRIREDLSQSDIYDKASGFDPSVFEAEQFPIEIHMTTDMCCEGINFRHHRLN